MENEEGFQKAVSRLLYRQSSYETRLTPSNYSEESDVSDNEENKKDFPKIIDVQTKSSYNNETKTPSNSRKCSADPSSVNKLKFQEELAKTVNSTINLKFGMKQSNLDHDVALKHISKKNISDKKIHQVKSCDQKQNVCITHKGIRKPKPSQNTRQQRNSEELYENLNACIKQDPKRFHKNQRNTEQIRDNSLYITKDLKKMENNESIQKMTEVFNNISLIGKEVDGNNSAEGNIYKSHFTNNLENALMKMKLKSGEREKELEELYQQNNDINQQDIMESAILMQKETECDINMKAKTSATGRLKALRISENPKVTEEDEERVGESCSRKEEMAAVRPKSPKPLVNKNEKDDSIWGKIGTLGRKKRIKEVQELQAEGKYAIDSPGHPALPEFPPEDYNLNENEERCMMAPNTSENKKFSCLVDILIDWINDELVSQRIIVQNLAEDLYDGQVLQKLLEKLTGEKLDAPEVTQSEEGQKQKLDVVLRYFNQILGVRYEDKWGVEAIHSKNTIPIIHLLVALARHFRAPIRLPDDVTVDVVVVQKTGGKLSHKTVRETLTTRYDDVGMRCERDAFDTLFDHAPEKLQIVKKSLVTFVNKHLNKLNFEVTELESQFHDGVYLIMLMGVLEGFFVPHYSFFLTPREYDQKVSNVSFAFELMEDVGLQKPKARPEDIVNMDLKSTLRVLYNLFLKYKDVS